MCLADLESRASLTRADDSAEVADLVLWMMARDPQNRPFILCLRLLITVSVSRCRQRPRAWSVSKRLTGYHDLSIDKDKKRQGFVTIISPLKAGKQASPAQEQAAIPAIPNTIPIHADILIGASSIAPNSSATWTIGGHGAVTSEQDRKIYVHLPMTKGGKRKIRMPDGRILAEGYSASSLSRRICL
ncbi:MAG: hypothetical protein LQ337_001016 [Flavoplaca oasis]|nr:MAG: hypothetical protein LQ337_001016 [Flavoplaca oasis]